jgi:MFS family permease
MAVATMLFLTPSGWLSDRLGERVTIAAGFASLAAAVGVFISSSTVLGFAVSWALFGVGMALDNPAYNSLISKVVPGRLRGTAFGLFSTSIGVISLPAPYLGAWLWERYSPQTPFYFPLFALLGLIPIVWLKFRLPERKQPPTAPSSSAREASPKGAAAERS